MESALTFSGGTGSKTATKRALKQHYFIAIIKFTDLAKRAQRMGQVNRCRLKVLAQY